MSTTVKEANVVIKPANSRHVDTLRSMMTQLHNEHHKREPELFKSAEEINQVKDIATYLDDPGCLVFVALDDNNDCIGFISGHFCELNSTVSKPVMMGSVDEFYVIPAFRQKGAGQQLLSQICSRFKEYGATQVFVEVWHSNSSATQMYQHSGFRHHVHWLRKPL